MVTSACNLGCATFLEWLAHADQRVLLLDYDGTIAPFTADRRRAVPYEPVPALLDRLMRTCQTRVVFVTSRPAREVPKLLGLDPHPEIWGTHGLERLMPNGSYSVEYIAEDGLRALCTAAEWGEQEGFHRLLELKPGAFALHWRGLAPDHVEDIRTRAYQVLAPLACQANLLLTEFDGGLELRIRGCNKGHAVRSILAETGSDVPVAYLGDDLTDEDAFRALDGRGLTVLVRPAFRPTAAEIWLRPPDELIQFLSNWVCACGGGA